MAGDPDNEMATQQHCQTVAAAGRHADGSTVPAIDRKRTGIPTSSRYPIALRWLIRTEKGHPMTRNRHTAARRSGLSIRQMSMQADIPFATVHRFVADDCELTLKTAAKLVTLPGLELRPIRRHSKGAS